MKHSIPTMALYTKVLVGLLLLTFFTFVQPSLLPLGTGETVGVQLLIAGMKVGLVIVYYMHLRRETTYLKGYVMMAFLILMVFFLMVGIDMLYT